MKETILVADSKRVSAIAVTEILRLESKGIYTIIHTKNNSKFISSKHLKIVESELRATFFFRVHKSHVVNLREIGVYEKGKGGTLVMSDGSLVPVSKRKKSEFLSRFKGE